MPGCSIPPTGSRRGWPETARANRSIEETTFAIGWKGRYRIEGPAFVYADNDSGRVTTILGYPTDQLAQIG